MDKSTNAADTWFIVSTAHGKYIGSTPVAISTIIQTQLDGAAIECRELLELITPVSQVPSEDPNKIGVAKEALATPLDVNSASAFSFLSLAGSRVTFFQHLSESDQQFYGRLILLARSMGSSWAANRSPIIRP